MLASLRLDRRGLRCALLSSCAALAAHDARAETMAIVAAKALVLSSDGPQVIDHAVLIARDGKIEAIGPKATTPVPLDCLVVDVGDSWIMPGMVDLHSHIGGTFDINDMVFQCNPELRVSTAVVPRNPELQRAIAAGVTTVLFIPGSGTNIGGQGILIKTGFSTFEEMRLREPGSLKIAQGDNPTRWGYGMGRSLMNHHIRDSVARGMAYAERWKRAEGGDQPEPEIELENEIFRALEAKRAQVSTHTQIYRLVLSTITMLKGEFGLDVFIDHGEFAGLRAAPLALEMGVGAIIGPREIDLWASRAGDTDGRVLGVAAGYQEAGMEVGFNTDAPVVPQEELFLQSAVSVRHGFKNDLAQAARGLTIVPARTAGIADRVGSLEPGKDADVVVITGDPSDPRSYVAKVFIEGRCVYDAAAEGRRF